MDSFNSSKPIGTLIENALRALPCLFLIFLFPVASMGEPAEKKTAEYVGSETCGECHEAHHEGWKSTLHSKMEQDPIREGRNANIRGDFSSDDPDLKFSLDDVDMLVGSRFKQRYAKRIGDDFYMLPSQWNVRAKEWVPYSPKKDWWAAEGHYPAEWDKRPTSRLCEGCHTTGFDIKTKQPVERNIGCESCHGPGSLHANNKGKGPIVNPASLGQERAAMVCFQCHMSGRPPKGEFETYAWPVGYQAGEDLRDYWIYAKPTGENGYEMWADGSAHKNRVQGNTFLQSKMYRKGVGCQTCHDSHGSRHVSFTLKSGLGNALCLTCHGQNAFKSVFTKSISEHTHHDPDTPGSRCVECHMPKTGKNAEKGESRDHSFNFISPLATQTFGTPNACNNCHSDETPEWAHKKTTQWKSQ